MAPVHRMATMQHIWKLTVVLGEREVFGGVYLDEASARAATSAARVIAEYMRPGALVELSEADCPIAGA